MTECVFWISLFGLAYIYLGYPLLMRGLARVRPMRRDKSPTDHLVSIVIACNRDSENVHRKLKTLLNSDQQKYIGQIFVGDDGAEGETRRLLETLNDPRVCVVEFAERRGKPVVLNALIPRCTSDIIVLCDARQILSDDTIPELTACFADPRVGVVSGELVFRTASGQTTAGRGIGAYWRYEKSIRKAEARFRSVPGATGALYAIRRELFRPIPENTLLDDVVIPMQIVTQGYLCVFEPNAIAWDDPSATLGKEAIRKRRTIAGAVQLAIRNPKWLLPWQNPIWFEYVSHKLLRLLSPGLLLAVALTNVLLLHDPLYHFLLILHGCFYYSAFAGWICQRIGRPSRLFGVQLMFLMLNVTTLAAIWDAVCGRFQVTWRKA